ncbi:MAG TPA: iron ABC transporter substrate-binding protein [Actinophytocola sp.]|uniref:iron ABC transporter substrate-binding protein n=1 Tax=Actinophytocola sp. TaxID=1872138 RepID=UPI002DDD4996|nr:iron ABC transporter substrate-binding protein [Actinophytocola sp.]HEV2781783.1 iron ABC transporter substrate-binding protein [Actinophytocola sp.]
MLSRRRVGAVALLLTLLAPTAVACGNGDGSGSDALVVYSGRTEQLVGGLLDQLREATGQDVEVRYGSSAELAAQILEEGDRSRVDLFFSQDAGALGALSDEGRLAQLPADVLNLVADKYRADDGTWVATSARARVVAYDPAQVRDSDLPSNLDAVVDPKWRGKIGYAPTNGSWQAFVTSVRVLRGEDGARDWLTKFAANEPKRFENNIAILDAVNKGQLALGLINHYYWYAKVTEEGADQVKARLHFVPGNDPLGLVNVAGVGIVNGSDRADAALKAVRFMLSEQGQRYFADQTAEYPVVKGITTTKHKLPPLDEIHGPDIDLSKLSSLQQTLAMLQEVGLS